MNRLFSGGLLMALVLVGCQREDCQCWDSKRIDKVCQRIIQKEYGGGMDVSVQVQGVVHQVRHQVVSVEVRLIWLTKATGSGYVWVEGILEQSEPGQGYLWREVKRSNNLDRHLAISQKNMHSQEVAR